VSWPPRAAGPGPTQALWARSRRWSSASTASVTVPAGPTGPWRRPLRPVRDLIEGVRLAEAVGLDFFGVGERRSLSMPVSAPGTFLAAAVTSRIGFGSTGVEEDRNRILR